MTSDPAAAERLSGRKSMRLLFVLLADPACVDAFLAAWPQALEIRARCHDDVAHIAARMAQP